MFHLYEEKAMNSLKQIQESIKALVGKVVKLSPEYNSYQSTRSYKNHENSMLTMQCECLKDHLVC